MTKKTDLILRQVLEKIEPPKEELTLIQNSVKDFIKTFEKKLKSARIKAEIFIGGSFAKNTVIKKDSYDVDIFIRFDKKYKEEDISKLTKKLLGNSKNIMKIHGSRDYFKIKIGPSFFLEIVPVIKVKNSKNYENITDLSYSHVRYIRKKVKSQKILDDIRIAKAFCYANNCYGAESYIEGFSGYSLELLVYYYQGFTKFLRAMEKTDKNKVVIDIEKYYKNKSQVLMDLNSAKLDSPVILIDPTYKQRNALAALSNETFKKFQKSCKTFLKAPSLSAFEIQKTDLEKIKRNAKKKKQEFLLLEAKTNKQVGDIAGSKLLKFNRHLTYEIKPFFQIKNKGFNYNGAKAARYFFVVKPKKEVLLRGPSLNEPKHVKRFKKKHKNTFERFNRIYAKDKIDYTLKQFILSWEKKNRQKLKEMSINFLKEKTLKLH